MADPVYLPSTTYDLTVGIPVNMDEAIYMVSPDDSPLITGLNADGLQILPVLGVDEKEFKWLDEELLTPRGTLGALLLTAGTTLTFGTAGEANNFSTGDLITIQSQNVDAATPEVVSIDAIIDSTSVTISRGVVGTAIQYDPSTIVVDVIGVGSYLAEGSDPENARTVDRVERSNYTQIFGPYRMTMSRTEMGRRKFGVANEFTHQLNNRITEMTIHRDQAFLMGRKKEDTANSKRATGGINEWITTNVDGTNTQITVANIDTNMQSCYDAGGVPDLLTANPKALADLNDLADTSRTRVTFEDVRRGRTPVRFVETEFGTLTIVRNRWCPVTLAVAWSREQATRRVFDPLIMKRLAITGDAENAMIVCEEGLEFKGEQHAFKMSKLTSYASAP